MADLTDIQAAQSIKIIGSDTSGVESTPAAVKTNQEVKTSDACDTAGSDILLTLDSTTPVEGKVGGSRLTNRKYVIMEALVNNVKWGFDTNCRFNLFKSQLIIMPIGNLPIYFKLSSGGSTPSAVALAEVS